MAVRRVGILTFLHTLNYGAVLQAYALGHAIGGEDVEAVQIDYRNETIESFEFKTGSMSLKRRVANLFRGRMIARKAARFEHFIDGFINATPPVSKTGLPAACAEFDRVVVGSDQVWNGRVTGFDDAYFLGFLDGSRKATYAVSIGQDELPVTEGVDYGRLISAFPRVLVREGTAARALAPYRPQGGIEVVLDPTLLLNHEKWEELASEARPPVEGLYVFVYAVGETEKAVEAGRRIARERNASLVVLQQNSFVPVRGAENLFDIGPLEFLACLKGADFVVTSSYHGLCLSLQMRKDFLISYATSKGQRNSRMSDLLDELGLSDRVVGANDAGGIDWEAVDGTLSLLRSASRTALRGELLG